MPDANAESPRAPWLGRGAAALLLLGVAACGDWPQRPAPTRPVRTSSQATAVRRTPPPPPAPVELAKDFDGVYAGPLVLTADRFVHNAGVCPTSHDVTLRVNEGVATLLWYGSEISGGIRSRGALAASGAAGAQRLTGRFANNRFTGNAVISGCRYSLELEKTE